MEHDKLVSRGALSRRAFCRGSLAAVAAAPVVAADVAVGMRAEQSGIVTGKPLALPYESLPGFLGKEQLRWHHDSHYAGALKGFVELDQNPAGDHRRRVAKMNSAMLHELYFANMSASPGEPGETTRRALKQRFGSVDAWLDDFRGAAKSARGWAMLVFQPVNRRLYDVITDSHDDGPPWQGIPLLVVDTYEHSYYLDFQNDKAGYVDGFCARIDWAVVERRMRQCLV